MGPEFKVKPVAVLSGGWSSGPSVGLNSGKACADAFEARGYRVTFRRCRPDGWRRAGEPSTRWLFPTRSMAPTAKMAPYRAPLEAIGIPDAQSGILAWLWP